MCSKSGLSSGQRMCVVCLSNQSAPLVRLVIFGDTIPPRGITLFLLTPALYSGEDTHTVGNEQKHPVSNPARNNLVLRGKDQTLDWEINQESLTFLSSILTVP